MSEGIQEARRAKFMGMLHSSQWGGILAGGIFTIFLITQIDAGLIIVALTIVTLCGSIPMCWLPNWKPKSNRDLLLPQAEKAGKAGIFPLLLYWAFIGVFNGYVLGVVPHFVRQTLDTDDTLFPVSVVSVSHAVGSTLGGILAGHLTNPLGEISILCLSSGVLLGSFGLVLYLLTVPFTYLWIIVGFANGMSDGFA